MLNLNETQLSKLEALAGTTVTVKTHGLKNDTGKIAISKWEKHGLSRLYITLYADGVAREKWWISLTDSQTSVGDKNPGARNRLNDIVAQLLGE